MGFGGGGGPTTSTTTSVRELSPEQRELINLVIPTARELIEQPPQLFPGSAIQPLDPLQLQAQENVLALAGVSPSTGPQVANPEIARIQARIAQIPATTSQQITNPEFARLQAEVQGLPQVPAGLPVVNLPGAELRQQLAGIPEFISQDVANPALAALQARLAGLSPTVGGPPQVAEGGGELGRFARSATSAAEFLLGPVLFPESNPALRAATEAAIRPLTENFQNVILPGIRGEAITAGGFGGSRQGIAEGLAAQGLTRQIGDVSATIQANAFQESLNAMTRALFAAPQTAQLPLLPSRAIEAVGAQRQAFGQAQLSEEVQRFLAEQLIPFATAQDVAALAFGIPGGSVTSTSTLPGGQSNNLATFIALASLAAPFTGGFGFPAAAALTL